MLGEFTSSPESLRFLFGSFLLLTGIFGIEPQLMLLDVYVFFFEGLPPLFPKNAFFYSHFSPKAVLLSSFPSRHFSFFFPQVP